MVKKADHVHMDRVLFGAAFTRPRAAASWSLTFALPFGAAVAYLRARAWRNAQATSTERSLPDCGPRPEAGSSTTRARGVSRRLVIPGGPCHALTLDSLHRPWRRPLGRALGPRAGRRSRRARARRHRCRLRGALPPGRDRCGRQDDTVTVCGPRTLYGAGPNGTLYYIEQCNLTVTPLKRRLILRSGPIPT